MSWRTCIAGLLLGASPLLLGATTPPLVIGVQTHFAFDDPQRTEARAFQSWMERSRFNSTRDEMYWWDVEDAAGTLALRQGAWRTRQMWSAMPAPFAGLLTLDFGNERYDSGGQPKSERARDAFARYASYVVAQSGQQVRWVEIWNEWNLRTGVKTQAGSRGDAADYAALARTTYRKLKAEHPETMVITGSSGDDLPDWPWMRRAIREGLLSHTDGIAVHLYNDCMRPAQVGADELAQRLDALQAIVAAEGRPQMPFFITEVGWPTHRGKCGVSEEAAAAHSVRFLLEASLRPWVAGVWFYEMQDGGDDPAEREHRFGLLRRDGSEKPAGCALREMGTQIAARPFAFTSVNSVGLAGFRNGATDRWLLWARGRSQQEVPVRLESASGTASFQSVSLCGMPGALMEIDPQGRFATVRVAPRTVQIIDVPAGQPLAMKELS